MRYATETRADQLIRVDLRSDFDLSAQSVYEERHVKVNLNHILEGTLAKIGANELMVLLVIAAHTHLEESECPSQREIGRLTGLSAATVNRALKNLNELKIDEKRVLGEVEIPTKKQTPSSSTEKRMSARSVLLYFCEKYQQEYQIPYMVNWKREAPIVKSKLIESYSDAEIMALIDYILANYRTKWAKPSYPYPTMNAICSWLANAAMQQMKQNEHRQSVASELVQLTSSYVDADYSDF